MVPVCIALGTNLGDRHAHLSWAVEQIGHTVQIHRTSAVIETEPVGVPDSQPPYLNAVSVGETDLSAHSLLDLLMRLERARGRERRSPLAARTLDLDLIFYGSEIIDIGGLTVPHPRFRDRRFVLEPLVEVAAEWRDPVTGKTVRTLLEELDSKEKGA